MFETLKKKLGWALRGFPLSAAEQKQLVVHIDSQGSGPLSPEAVRHTIHRLKTQRSKRRSVNEVDAFTLMGAAYANTAEGVLLRELLKRDVSSISAGRILRDKGISYRQPTRAMGRVKKALRRSCMDLGVRRQGIGRHKINVYYLSIFQKAALEPRHFG